MTDSAAQDNNTASGLVPLSKNGATASLVTRYNGNQSIASVSNIFNGSFRSLVAREDINENPSNRVNGSATLNASSVTFNYSANELFVGGRRTGVGGGGTDYLNGDVV